MYQSIKNEAVPFGSGVTDGAVWSISPALPQGGILSMETEGEGGGTLRMEKRANAAPVSRTCYVVTAEWTRGTAVVRRRTPIGIEILTAAAVVGGAEDAVDKIENGEEEEVCPLPEE